MGLLALDVSRFGIVMSADSQPIQLSAGRTRIEQSPGQRSRNPIVIRTAGGFVGLVGSVGQSRIGGIDTRSWLEQFGSQHSTLGLPDYCQALGDALTDYWQRRRLKSALWVFVSGVEGREVRFWFISNTYGPINPDGTYSIVRPSFNVVNDLDDNYISRDIAQGVAKTKDELLLGRLYFLRNGALWPSTIIFDSFSGIVQSLYAQRHRGFPPLRSLDDLAFVDRQRMEFTKRIYNSEYGISRAAVPQIGGVVHVLGVTREGEIRKYSKGRDQIKQIYP